MDGGTMLWKNLIRNKRAENMLVRFNFFSNTLQVNVMYYYSYLHIITSAQMDFIFIFSERERSLKDLEMILEHQQQVWIIKLSLLWITWQLMNKLPKNSFGNVLENDFPEVLSGNLEYVWDNSMCPTRDNKESLCF